MTTKTNATDKRSWIVRKGIYFIFGAGLAIAAIFGWITTEQADEWLDIAARTIESVAAAALIFAGTKTHRGSDDHTTKDDVVAAAVSGPVDVLNDLRSKVEELRENVTKIVSPIGAEYPAPAPVTTPPGQRGGTYPKGQ